MHCTSSPISFLATTSAERATAFFRDVLGRSMVADEPFALVFDAVGAPRRLAKVQSLTPQPVTVLHLSRENRHHAR